MARLTGTLSRLGPCKVLIIGDLLLDSYTIGKAKRISPEAPVAVVNVHKEEHRPGGAGNVALNVLSMGCLVSLVGRVGPDKAGTMIVDELSKEKGDVSGIVVQPNYDTPVKNRIIAENQQIVRIDYEKVVPLPEMLEQQVVESLPQLLEDVKIVSISDYGKGFLTRTLLSAIIHHCRARGIPIIADPKGIEFDKYKGTTILKPNLSEAYAAANLPHDAPLEQVAAKILHLAHSDVLMITRSEAGISVFSKNGSREDFPVKIKEVKDVTGAGDTVLAMLTCALGNGLSLQEAAQLSNFAAGIAIERFGCARISISDLARRLLEHDLANKIFDQEHIFALQRAISGRKFALLGINGEQGLTSAIFSAIRKLSQVVECDLLVYVKDKQPCPEFVNLLASLHEIDFILVHGDSLRNLCESISPEMVYEVKGNAMELVSNVTTLLQVEV